MEPNNTLLVVPGPRDHLKGTLALLKDLDLPDALRRFLERPHVLPSDIEPDDAGLKYDMYVTATDRELRWGLAIADRHEETMLAAVRELAAGLGGSYPLERVLEMRAELVEQHALCVAIGFDKQGKPPRLKLYFQEDPWGTGVGTVDQLRTVIPGLPDWIDGDRNVGVMTVGMHADGHFQPKIYLGGSTALEAAAGSPAMDLAETMHRRCTQPGYYYLTVRPGPDGAQSPR